MGITLHPAGNAAAPTNRWSPAVGLGCVALFLVPFGVAGLFAFVTGMRQVLQGNPHGGGPLLLVGTLFGGVAIGGWALLLVARRRQREVEALQARHPAQPWLWRQDWATGRITDSSRSTVWTSWTFATFWNLISFPSAFLALKSARGHANAAVYLALLFPLAGTGLLVWAIRNALRYRKYGTSLLELSTIPGVVGHSLAGQVRASNLLQQSEGFDLTLSCIRRVTTQSGDDSSTTETILWQEEQRVRGEPSRGPEGMTTRVPVGFRIPPDARDSDSRDSRDQILWRLTVSAEAPGVDYASAFEVPVFRTPASDLPATPQDLVLSRDLPLDYQPPRDSRIRVIKNRGGTEITFPAARNPGAAFSLTLFTVLWGISIAAMLYLKAPILFPIVFGAFELLLLYGTIQLWLGVSRVVIDRGSISVAEGYLVPGPERTIGAGDLAEVTTKIGMQAGAQPYYDVVVVTRGGKRIAAGRWIRNKREAEWLAATMQDALRLEPTSPAAPDSRRLR